MMLHEFREGDWRSVNAWLYFILLTIPPSALSVALYAVYQGFGGNMVTLSSESTEYWIILILCILIFPVFSLLFVYKFFELSKSHDRKNVIFPYLCCAFLIFFMAIFVKLSLIVYETLVSFDPPNILTALLIYYLSAFLGVVQFGWVLRTPRKKSGDST